MSYKEEHPDWIAPSDFRLDELEKLGFEDISWHNDGCPFFENEKRGLNLHVDYQEEMSDAPSNPFMRYHLLRYDYDIETKEYDQSGWNADLLISSNTFADIIKAIKGETSMKETIDKIAKLFIKSLTLEELEYCTRKPSIGFSALHDRFCANEALMAVIDKFVRNDLVPDDCPDNLGELIDDFDFLNKCGERITELLKALCGDGFRICTQEIFKE